MARTENIEMGDDSAKSSETGSSNSRNENNAQSSESGSQYRSSKQLQLAKAQVNEAIDIMKSNVDSVMKREARLNDLDSRAENLHHGASQFQQSSRSLRNKYWWQNIKLMIIIGIISVFIILLLVIWISN